MSAIFPDVLGSRMAVTILDLAWFSPAQRRNSRNFPRVAFLVVDLGVCHVQGCSRKQNSRETLDFARFFASATTQFAKFQAFRDSMLTALVFLPVEAAANEFRVRLAVLWRENIIITSPAVQQTLLLPAGAEPSQPELVASLQITARSWAVCWNAEKHAGAPGEEAKFR